MKIKVIQVIVLGILTISLAACGTENNDTSKQSEQNVQSEAEPKSNTLTVWTWDPNFNIYAIEKAADMYRKNGHDGFSVEVTEVSSAEVETKLITAATAGDLSTLPDIFMLRDESFQKFVKNYPDIFYDLTDSGIAFDEFSPAKVAYSTVDGKNMGIPFDSGAVVNCIRKDMIEQAGFTVEDFTDITWSEFIDKARIVKDKTGMAMLSQQAGEPSLIMMMLQSCGASVFNEDGSLNIMDNDILKQCIVLYVQMVREGLLTEVTSWDQYVASLNNATIAGCCNGCWVLSSIVAAEDQSNKWAVTNIPRLDNVKGAVNYSNNGGSSWAISSNCQSPDIALDFFKSTLAGSVELYDELLEKGVLATWSKVGESESYGEAVPFFGNDLVYKKIVEYSQKIPSNYSSPFYFDATEAIGVGLTNIIQNNVNIDTELKNINDTVQFNIDAAN